MKDEEYRVFVAKLTPSLDKNRIMGVRMPNIRNFARKIDVVLAERFMSELPHEFYDEDNLHASLISRIKSFDACIIRVEEFLPYIDNWATCDMLRPNCFKGNENKLLPYVEKWLKADGVYTVRFAIGILLSHFLDAKFEPYQLKWVESVRSDEYYLKMMVAWYFATALAKQYDETVKFFENNVLEAWTHNKALQKALESFRVDENTKKYLRTLKRKIK